MWNRSRVTAGLKPELLSLTSTKRRVKVDQSATASPPGKGCIKRRRA
jgi:hypothetical protein